MREESEAVNESFWDATGVEIEAKQVLGFLRHSWGQSSSGAPMFEACFVKLWAVVRQIVGRVSSNCGQLFVNLWVVFRQIVGRFSSNGGPSSVKL